MAQFFIFTINMLLKHIGFPDFFLVKYVLFFIFEHYMYKIDQWLDEISEIN